MDIIVSEEQLDSLVMPKNSCIFWPCVHILSYSDLFDMDIKIWVKKTLKLHSFSCAWLAWSLTEKENQKKRNF